MIPHAPVDPRTAALLGEWRPIPGWEGTYQAHPDGRIRSLTRTVTDSKGVSYEVRGRVLKPVPDPRKGYCKVTLQRSGERWQCLVHKLIALTFIGPRPEGMQIAHNDGDPANNAASNLRYATPSENELDKWNHGTNREALRSHCRQGHPFDEANTYRDKNGWRVCRTCRNAAVKKAPSYGKKRIRVNRRQAA